MATIGKIKAGQVLYKVTRQKMGNTTASRGVVNRITVEEVDPAGEWVIARYNHMKARKYYTHQVSLWRVSEPKVKRYVFGMASY